MSEKKNWNVVCIIETSIRSQTEKIKYLATNDLTHGALNKFFTNDVSVQVAYVMKDYTEQEANNLVTAMSAMPEEAKKKFITEVPKGPIQL